LLVAGVVVCAFLVIDFITPLVWETNEEWIMAVALGICIGQINLIATWAALAPGNAALRLPWAMLLGVLMWYAIVLGCRVAIGHYRLEDAVFLGIILLADIIATQIPLWIARWKFRWRLISPGTSADEAVEGPFQFYLWHLFVGMFFVSVALAPARMVLPPGDAWSFRIDHELPVLLPAVILCNLVITIPCIWGAFARREKIGAIVIGWPFYCAILTGIELAVLIAILGPPGGQTGEIYWVFYLLNLSQCITVFGALLIFRAIGFQLIRAPKP